SFRQVVGRSLGDWPEDLEPIERSRRLFHAPFVVVSHGTEADPIFNYANQRAIDLWEFSWDEFVQLPSRWSVEPIAQEERAKMLAEAADRGYINNYQGIRISKTGRRFRIMNTIVWNLTDEAGNFYGQGATFADIVPIEIVPIESAP
ncbi:MAG TPA: MEKHLA domain-containing protein, partial [Coleofasciculaceae cyanobacterium]